MMDVTRSALYFAKGAILVEGISEALLVPALAEQLGHDLRKAHVSVLPICGVAFGTLAKLLHNDALGTPVAIITDGDPSVQYADKEKKDWRTATPKQANGAFEECDRLKALRVAFKDHSNVQIFSSHVTLEYDLANAGDENAVMIAAVWETLFKGTPGTLKKSMIDAAGKRADKALAVWRGICVANTSGSKADFAHRLTATLEGDEGLDVSKFVVPDYIKNAIEFVLARTGQTIAKQANVEQKSTPTAAGDE